MPENEDVIAAPESEEGSTPSVQIELPVEAPETPPAALPEAGPHPQDIMNAKIRLRSVGGNVKDPAKALAAVRAAESKLEIAWPEEAALFIARLEEGDLSLQEIRQGLRGLGAILPRVMSGDPITEEDLVAFKPAEKVIVEPPTSAPAQIVWLKKNGEDAGPGVNGFMEAVYDQLVKDEEDDEDDAPTEADVLRALADDLSTSKNSVHRSAVGLLFDLAERLDGADPSSGALKERTKQLEEECRALRGQLDDLEDYLMTKRGEIRAHEKVVDVAIGLMEEMAQGKEVAPSPSREDRLAVLELELNRLDRDARDVESRLRYLEDKS